jgi:hypothetical protein
MTLPSKAPLFLLVYMNYTEGSYCDVSHMHIMCFDQIHPLFLFLTPLLFYNFNGFHPSISTNACKVLQSCSPAHHSHLFLSPFTLVSPQQSPFYFHVIVRR